MNPYEYMFKDVSDIPKTDVFAQVLNFKILDSGGPNRTGLTGFTGPVRYPVRFGPVRYFPQIPNRTFLMKCVPK